MVQQKYLTSYLLALLTLNLSSALVLQEGEYFPFRVRTEFYNAKNCGDSSDKFKFDDPAETFSLDPDKCQKTNHITGPNTNHLWNATRVRLDGPTYETYKYSCSLHVYQDPECETLDTTVTRFGDRHSDCTALTPIDKRTYGKEPSGSIKATCKKTQDLKNSL